MYFCWVLFTFNKYSEFLASLEICINETLDCGEWIVSSPYGKVLSSLYCVSQCCEVLLSLCCKSGLRYVKW
jgi:hypothetical protein